MTIKEATRIAALVVAAVMLTLWIAAARQGWIWALWVPVMVWSIRLAIRTYFVIKEDRE